MSFFCPHFEMQDERCTKLGAPCVPGRPGCVLCGKVTFMEPARERVKRTRKSAPVPKVTKPHA